MFARLEKEAIKLISIDVRMGVVTCCIVFAAAASGHSQEPFRVGWYDTLIDWANPEGIKNYGGNISLGYWGSNASIPVVDIYLDRAQAVGMKVIVEIDPVAIAAKDAAAIRGIVQAFDSHPAVYGWYTADEPWVHGIPLSTLQFAYNTVKLDSSKPVFMTIEEPAVAAGKPVEYKNAYDHFLADSYPFRAVSGPGQTTYEVEFTGLELEPGRVYKSDWKGDMRRAKTQSQQAGRPWWSAMQGWGADVGETDNYRLPTFNEARFMEYYSLLQNASALMHFVYYRASQFTPAQPGTPYPYDGVQWLADVWSPLTTEINALGPAIQWGKISSAVVDSRLDIETMVYQDPITSVYYLVALNTTRGVENPTFTLQLPQSMARAIPMFESRSPILVNGGLFSDTFTDYQVHVYKLVSTPSTPGDFDGDGDVDGADFVAWQTHFPTASGATLVDGDADGDGDVDGADFVVWQTNFPFTPGSSAALPLEICEPANFTLMLLGLSALLILRTLRSSAAAPGPGRC